MQLKGDEAISTFRMPLNQIPSELNSNLNLAQEFQLHPLIFSLIEKRGFAASPSGLERFLKPSSAHFRDPLLMKGMPEAVELIRRARSSGASLLLHGDYDADGISSTALLSKALSKLGVSHSVFLPERSKNGYGLSREGVEVAKKKGASLLVTLDCGISSLEEVRLAKAFGIQTLILDHHKMKPELPEATAIVHPLLEGNEYPFKGFSAAGLSYKLAQALLGRGALEFLELGALGTVADLVPLVDENRTLVRGGLKQLSENPSLGFQELKKVGSVRTNKIQTTHLEFIFSPRINAAGRLGSPMPSFELLTTDSFEKASQLAKQLDLDNKERQRIEREIVKHALGKAEIEFNWARDRIFFLWDAAWHAGVVGIVASRIVEKYKKPALVAGMDKGLVKGSGRSVKGFNLFALLEKHRDLFESFGGHEQACGFTLLPERVDELKECLQKSALQTLEGKNFSHTVDIDLELSFRDLDEFFFASLGRMEPFGMGNPRPVFWVSGLKVKGTPIRRGESLRFWVEQGGKVFEVFWPRAENESLRGGEIIDLAFSVEKNYYLGTESWTLKVKEIVRRNS
jgi:single-stranded-DNA-specific exonuclease